MCVYVCVRGQARTRMRALVCMHVYVYLCACTLACQQQTRREVGCQRRRNVQTRGPLCCRHRRLTHVRPACGCACRFKAAAVPARYAQEQVDDMSSSVLRQVRAPPPPCPSVRHLSMPLRAMASARSPSPLACSTWRARRRGWVAERVGARARVLAGSLCAGGGGCRWRARTHTHTHTHTHTQRGPRSRQLASGVSCGVLLVPLNCSVSTACFDCAGCALLRAPPSRADVRACCQRMRAANALAAPSHMVCRPTQRRVAFEHPLKWHDVHASGGTMATPFRMASWPCP